MEALPPFLENWMKLFSLAVRDRDFGAGQKLFDDRVISFGTVCIRMESLNDLISRQWRRVWQKTTGFDFEYESARASVTAGLAIVIANWRCVGLDNGSSFPRTGRATIVLRESTGWKAVHTHFSLDPASGP